MADTVEKGKVRVGQRLSVTGYRCTVRFVGTLAGVQVPRAEEEWLGVEWDEPGRGKNSGQVKGKSFFEVEVAGAGSFLRRDAIKEALADRALLSEAAQKRYDATAEVLACVKFAGGKELDICGAEEESVPPREAVDVQGMNVAFLDVQAFASGAFVSPSLRELNLSDNLLSDWD
eukprot:CAMPEP_0119127992 /NCGR_PEP_ID=MMETSP1310-20130426/6319_1 /TAXON_ID=464262 /ORGANISM="Genus nov. species nov., Strain RCC2339" /LENGTH=173 /DNA_ID=CAMNT_0007118283 /DNA_START=85 /DNA_END=603 /DNA_ORIENTATION=-